MCKLKKLPVILSLLFCMTIADNLQADFVGKWCWDKDSDVSTFSIVINKIGDTYKGGYYAVAQSGNIIDDNDLAFTFNEKQNNTVKTILTSGISGNEGHMQLTILDEKKIIWKVLNRPKGGIYVPNEAVLYRCK